MGQLWTPGSGGGSTTDPRAAYTEGTHAQRLAAAAPAASTAGQVWLETDTGVVYIDTGATWRPTGVGTVLKTADETVNNSAALQNDDHLKFPIEAGETWYVEALLLLTAVSAIADYKVGWTGPAAATASWFVLGSVGQAAGISGSQLATGSSPFALAGLAGTAAFGAAALTFAAHVQGVFASPTNAGTIQFQWAQNTATVEDNKVLQNSFLRLRRLV